MRTTLNLDADVARELGDMARSQGRSVSQIANAVLRGGLLAARHPAALPPYEPPTFDSGKPLMDVTDIGETMEVLDAS